MRTRLPIHIRRVQRYTANWSIQMPVIALLSLAITGCTWHPGLRNPAARALGWPQTLVGAWTLVNVPGDTSRTAPTASAQHPRDTTVLQIEENGRLQYGRVRLHMKNGVLTATEEQILRATWWVEDPGADTTRPHEICWSRRPGRFGYQCAAVSVDTVRDSASHLTHRLMWQSTTSKQRGQMFITRE